MKLLILLNIAFFPILLFAQFDTTYYKSEKICARDTAEYYIIESKENNFSGIKKYFYINNNNIYKEVEYVNGKVNGLYKEYFENSQIKISGEKDGYFFKSNYEEWYENGQKKEEGKYDGVDKTMDRGSYRIRNYWTENGSQEIENGSGNCTEYSSFFDEKAMGKFENGVKIGKWQGGDSLLSYEEFYKEGNLTGGFSVKNGKRYKYDKLEVSAQPINGMGLFLKSVMTYCGKNYPEKAMKKGVQGRNFVEFVIEKDGSLSNIKIKDNTSLSEELDKVSIDAVKQGGKWNPGKQRGIPVRQIMILPVKYKL